MKLYAAYVSSLYEDFDPAEHCREEDSGFAMTMRETEGAIATVEIERRQTGWSILGTDQPRYCIISWTPTDDPADAVVLARGRIAELPDDLFGSSQTLTIECAPADSDDLILAWAKETLSSAPETDLLFSDADPESVDTYLLGRSATISVDPATHDFELCDDLIGTVVHDLANVAFVDSSGPGTYDPPVATYRATLSVDWTQEASGEVDIASRIAPLGRAITTLDAGFAGRIEQSLSASGSEGWSTTGGVEVSVRIGESGAADVGSVYRSVVNKWNRTALKSINDVEVDAYYQRGDQGTIYANGSAFPSFIQHSVTIKKFPVSYSYSQARQDVAYLALDAAVQNSAVVRDRDVEVFEWSLGDIFIDADYLPWISDHDYTAGDQVRYGDRYYECVADHTSSDFFDEDRGIVVKRRIEGISPPVFDTTRTFWIRIRSAKTVDPASTTRFLSTARGERCLRHAMLRLRKEARRRLRARHVSILVPWENGHQVRLVDAVRILVPWDDQGAHRAAVGKVVGIERRWDGEKGATVAIDIGIPFGIGGTPAPAGDHYVDEGYVDDGHFDGYPERDLDYAVQADDPVVPVDAFQLRSPNYACLESQVRNEAGDQLDGASAITSVGGEITEISVRRPTTIKVRMRSLAASPEPLVRELDVVGQLLVTPAGIDLT